MVARSYRVIWADIKSLLISALVSLETGLKVTILAIFEDFWHFSSCPFWHKSLTYDNDFFKENLVQCMYFYVQ